MALVQRFTTVTQGAMVLTGNSLTVRQNSNYPPGVDYRQGAYISTNTALVAAAGFPNGTTFNAAQCSSTAVLNIPSGSTVLYAQLFWVMDTGAPLPDSSISLILPTNTTVTISPNLALKQTVTRIWQAQDVTTIVNAAGAGTYTVANVPGTAITNGVSIFPNAWYMLIVYKNQNLPYRYFNVNTGIASVANGSPSDFNFTGFVTPVTGAIKGYLLVSESDGDLLDAANIFVGANLAGATKIGNTSTGAWNNVAPYAQENNILPGNILIADTNDTNIGLLDTRGSFGTFNKNPFNTTAPAFARVNTDILGVDISNKLTNNQSSLFTRIFYGGTGSGEVTSQSVQVDVNSANLSNLTKTANKSYAVVGDTITYTVTFTNTGLADANNVVFMDTIPSNTSFIGGSVYVDGFHLPGADPSLMSFGKINAGQGRTITFDVTVTSTIPSYSVGNTSQVTYSFIPGTSLPTQYAEANSILVNTTIVDATITKSSTPSIVRAGDTITYTNVYRFLNVPTTISNVILQDTIPTNTTFVPNSVVVNGITIPGANTNPPGLTIQSSITLPMVFTVNFKVTANTVTQTTTIPNAATGIYSFNNGIGTETISANSSIVNTVIDSFNASMTKTVDKSYADIGETITYTVVINNSGTTLNNVIFLDTIPIGTALVQDSFVDGDTTILSANPSSGVLLSTISAGSVRTITFKVRANTIPSPNPISNSATTTLNYTLYTLNDSSAGINSGIVFTTISNASLSVLKIVNKNYATVGDTLTYTVVFTNTGNTSADNIVFVDTIPIGTSFVSGSVNINGVTSVNANPALPGINLSSIGANKTTTVSFNVLVSATYPYPSTFTNTSQVSYNYSLSPGNIITAETTTNTVSTTLSIADISAKKIVGSLFANVGDILTYTIPITNTGTTITKSLQFSDKISPNLVIVPKSFKQDGVLKAGTLVYPGLTLDNIPPNTTSTITFKVKIVKPISSGEIINTATISYSYTVNPTTQQVVKSSTSTNAVQTTVNMANLSNIRKRVDKTDAMIGDKLIYTISITNTGDAIARDVILKDKLSRGASFIPGSVTINGVADLNANPIYPGIELGELLPNKSLVITYKVEVVAVLPPPCEVVNVANVGYTYTSGEEEIIAFKDSNTVVTELASIQIPFKE